MARTGATQKDVKHGRTPNLGQNIVENIPYDGPGSEMELPQMDGMRWFPAVELWWKSVRKMPHCVLWEEGDWLAAIELSVLKNLFYAEVFGGTVHASMASEIRQREALLGTTMEARRKLGIKYVDPAPEDEQQDGETEHSAPAAGGGVVRPIGSAPSRRQQLAEDEAA